MNRSKNGARKHQLKYTGKKKSKPGRSKKNGINERK